MNIALNEILTTEAHQHAAELGSLLISGIQTLFDEHELPWKAQSLITRSGYTFCPELPQNTVQFADYENQMLHELLRVFTANRVIWEAIFSAGPSVSFSMSISDIGQSLQVMDEFLSEIDR